MMTNEKPWEQVGMHLYRFKVEGGYLYLHEYPIESGKSMCFVPDSQSNVSQDDVPNVKELYNKMAELSMKLNEMHSKLREFEKQKVEPLRERIERVDYRSSKSAEQFDERIEELESEKTTNSTFRKAFDQVLGNQRERIEKLESTIKENRKYISDCDKQRFDSDEELRERINNLEMIVSKFPKTHDKQYQDRPTEMERLAPEPECLHEWDRCEELASFSITFRCKKCGSPHRMPKK